LVNASGPSSPAAAVLQHGSPHAAIRASRPITAVSDGLIVSTMKLVAKGHLMTILPSRSKMDNSHTDEPGRIAVPQYRTRDFDASFAAISDVMAQSEFGGCELLHLCGTARPLGSALTIIAPTASSQLCASSNIFAWECGLTEGFDTRDLKNAKALLAELSARP
jgi:hypothetical protein